jgi:hypothetical protein
MEIQQHQQLIRVLQEDFLDKPAGVHFTQWDTDDEDEEVTQFCGELKELRLTDNEFGEKDLLLLFSLEEGESVEILMEIPKEEEDLAAYADGRLSIFGTEAELVLER